MKKPDMFSDLVLAGPLQIFVFESNSCFFESIHILALLSSNALKPNSSFSIFFENFCCLLKQKEKMERREEVERERMRKE